MDFYDRQEAEQRARAKRREEEHAAAVAAAPPGARWEYKVLENSALAGWKSGKISDLEPLLNQYAEAGWRVIAMSFTGQISQTLARDKNHLYVVLERERQPA
ncbi:MAG: DUF4177 domain-containing protein [Solirubrobacteraceae bacterium]|nr:DUF4177 domain-containing protein [Patulibacter sp.]